VTSDDTLTTLGNLYEANTTWSEDDAVQIRRRQAAEQLVIAIIKEPVDEALIGILWLFPTAVCPAPEERIDQLVRSMGQTELITDRADYPCDQSWGPYPLQHPSTVMVPILRSSPLDNPRFPEHVRFSPRPPRST